VPAPMPMPVPQSTPTSTGKVRTRGRSVWWAGPAAENEAPSTPCDGGQPYLTTPEQRMPARQPSLSPSAYGKARTPSPGRWSCLKTNGTPRRRDELRPVTSVRLVRRSESQRLQARQAREGT